MLGKEEQPLCSPDSGLSVMIFTNEKFLTLSVMWSAVLSLGGGEMFHGRSTWGEICDSGKDSGKNNTKMINKILKKWQQCVHKEDFHTICTVFTVRKTSFAVGQCFERR